MLMRIFDVCDLCVTCDVTSLIYSLSIPTNVTCVSDIPTFLDTRVGQWGFYTILILKVKVVGSSTYLVNRAVGTGAGYSCSN